jgi:hypothetical protein
MVISALLVKKLLELFPERPEDIKWTTNLSKVYLHRTSNGGKGRSACNHLVIEEFDNPWGSRPIQLSVYGPIAKEAELPVFISFRR